MPSLAWYNLGALNVPGPPKLFAGYEHIRYSNPSTPLTAGFDDIGGYKLAFVNNTAFPTDKVLQVFWAGVRLHGRSGSGSDRSLLRIRAE
jgi:hypothetical protein